MPTSYIIWSSILALLITFLWVKLWLRHRFEKRAGAARLRAIDAQFPCTGFDTSGIAPQIRRVREDYVSSARPRWRLTHFRAGLVAAAHRMVVGLAYFRCSAHEHDLHKDDV